MQTLPEYCEEALQNAYKLWSELGMDEKTKIAEIVRNLPENTGNEMISARFANIGLLTMLAVDPAFAAATLDDEEREESKWGSRRF